MAEYKLVDSEKLDSDLKDIADTIRDNLGTTNSLYFPSGFRSNINSIGGKANEVHKEYINGTLEEVPESITENLYSVRAYCFAFQLKLKKVSLPKTLKSIGDGAFFSCQSLLLNELPESVSDIGLRAFDTCVNITISKIPENVSLILENSFAYCFGITNMTIPQKVKRIDRYAFIGCSSLTEVTFQGTPEIVEGNVFNSCYNLTTINVPWSEGEVANAPWGATNATINYNYTGG